MKIETKSCPYPGTCRYYRVVEGTAHCGREECPFRIHLRRLVAGEIQRLSKERDLDPQRLRELEVLKGQYARLLRGGDPHGGKKTQASQKPPCPESGGGNLSAGL
nr:MAG TPA: hypothetical protein [Caudoviricetes sp.]